MTNTNETPQTTFEFFIESNGIVVYESSLHSTDKAFETFTDALSDAKTKVDDFGIPNPEITIQEWFDHDDDSDLAREEVSFEKISV